MALTAITVTKLYRDKEVFKDECPPNCPIRSISMVRSLDAIFCAVVDWAWECSA